MATSFRASARDEGNNCLNIICSLGYLTPLEYYRSSDQAEKCDAQI